MTTRRNPGGYGPIVEYRCSKWGTDVAKAAVKDLVYAGFYADLVEEWGDRVDLTINTDAPRDIVLWYLQQHQTRLDPVPKKKPDPRWSLPEKILLSDFANHYAKKCGFAAPRLDEESDLHLLNRWCTAYERYIGEASDSVDSLWPSANKAWAFLDKLWGNEGAI